MSGTPGGQGLVSSPSTNKPSMVKHQACFVYRTNCHELCIPCYASFVSDGDITLYVTNKLVNGATLGTLDITDFELIGDQLCLVLTDEEILPYLKYDKLFITAVAETSLTQGECNCVADFEVVLDKLPIDEGL